MNWTNDEEFITAYNNFTCEYIPAQIELAYHFWKLSRQSLVVKLPVTYTVESAWIDALEVDSNEQYFSVDSIKEVFDAAGVRYE